MGRQGDRPRCLRSRRLIYDPDPSLLRAGLLDGFALAHGLARVADGVDYLTGEQLISTPFLTAFQVLEVSASGPQALRRLIAKNEIGTLEIKVRGVDIAPETLRRQLDLGGGRAASLLVVGGSGPVRAVLAQRASTGGSTTLPSTAGATIRIGWFGRRHAERVRLDDRRCPIAAHSA